jgi:hypothetical protein
VIIASFIRISLYVIGAVILFLVTVFTFQRSLQYFPNTSDPGAPSGHGLPEMEITRSRTHDGYTLNGWYAAPREPGGLVVVLFHGNAGNISHRAQKARQMIDAGLGVYLVEYRGYGGNPGRPTEEGLYHDARAVLRALQGKHRISPDHMIFYGESLGTGVAVQMASELKPKLVVLEAPFASAADVAKVHYPFLPVDLLMQDRFDSIEKIKTVKVPVYIVHGDEDNVIPLSQAQKLFEAANHPKEINVINGGGHSDLYDHHAGHLILDWIKTQTQPEAAHDPEPAR